MALELYESAEPSWRKMASKLPVNDVPKFTKGEKDMRALEPSPRFKKARADVIKRLHALNDLEWEMLSKRSHGDISALVQVSHNLGYRGAEVGPGINLTQPAGKGANIMLNRASGWVLLCLGHIVAEIGIETNGKVERLFKKFENMQESDDRSGALRINPVGD